MAQSINYTREFLENRIEPANGSWDQFLQLNINQKLYDKSEGYDNSSSFVKELKDFLANMQNNLSEEKVRNKMSNNNISFGAAVKEMQNEFFSLARKTDRFNKVIKLADKYNVLEKIYEIPYEKFMAREQYMSTPMTHKDSLKDRTSSRHGYVYAGETMPANKVTWDPKYQNVHHSHSAVYQTDKTSGRGGRY